ncbi:MAG: HAMP domain-containing sensor histidine kinase [Gemmatimonadaceae bacterium]
MTLRARLALSLAIIALVFIVPIVFLRTSMKTLHDDVRALQDSEFRSSLVLGRLRDALADVRAREVVLGVLKTDEEHDALRKAIHKAHGLADTLASITRDSTARTIAPILDSILTIADREFALWRAGHDPAGDSISQNVMVPVMHVVEGKLTPTERVLREGTSTKVQDAELSLQKAEDVSITALAVALVLATLIGFWLTRSISGPVEALERGMRAVAGGELEHQLELSPKRRDEFGRLAGSFREMSRQLAELDKLKAEFVSVASHELKTPINVILGYLQLMQEGIYGPLSPKQSEVLGTVEAQGRTLARLAAHLLDVTRFEAGGGRIEPRPVRLTSLLEELERAFHVLAVQRNVTFRVSLRPELPSDVHWDVDRINEVLGNLLANAFKFTPAGGRVELIATPSDDHVRFEVRDTGAGIAPDQLPHIFEKFYQADNQRSASATGSGLGLAIAKEIVEAHRGTIQCTSTVGAGTTFTLLLPVVAGNNRRRSDSQHAVELEAVS